MDVMNTHIVYAASCVLVLSIGCARPRQYVAKVSRNASRPHQSDVLNAKPSDQFASNDPSANHASLIATVAYETIEDGAATYSLADFEQIALNNNPTIAELVATTQKAAGFRTQVGLRANPIVGYNGTQIADSRTDQHTAYISQTIITADKLALNRRVLNEALGPRVICLETRGDARAIKRNDKV